MTELHFPVQVPNVCIEFSPDRYSSRQRYHPKYYVAFFKAHMPNLPEDRQVVEKPLDYMNQYQRHLLFSTIDSIDAEYARLQNMFGEASLNNIFPTKDALASAIEDCIAEYAEGDVFLNEDAYEQSPEVSVPETAELDIVDKQLAIALAKHGFDTVAKLADAEVSDLIPVPTVGKATAAKLIEAAKGAQ